MLHRLVLPFIEHDSQNDDANQQDHRCDSDPTQNNSGCRQALSFHLII